MREGVELGVVQPRVLMEKTLPQLAAQLVESPEQSAFWGPVARMPESFSDEDRSRIEDAYRDHIMNVLVPAYAKLHDYVANDYMEHTRETVGQSDSPGGKDYYAFMVRESTTTDYTPEEIHEIQSEEEILKAYDDLRNTIDPKLPALFGTLAEAPYVIKAVEPFRAESMAAAQYFPGTPDPLEGDLLGINSPKRTPEKSASGGGQAYRAP